MTIEKACLAGGCFWGMEEFFLNLNGVNKTCVGYTGGNLANPTYDIVKAGKSGHAEAIEIEFDTQKITYQEVLELFFRLHNPTTLNQQGGDIGSQYRSAIFYYSEEQKSTAQAVKKQIDASKKWPKPIVTEITAAKKFYSAEEEHQKYLAKHPGGYSCHFLRD